MKHLFFFYIIHLKQKLFEFQFICIYAPTSILIKNTCHKINSIKEWISYEKKAFVLSPDTFYVHYIENNFLCEFDNTVIKYTKIPKIKF